MSTDENRTPSAHFPRLNETNYSEWSIRMEAQLIRLGLWDQVVCDFEPTTPEDDAKAKDAWLKKRKAPKMAEARAEIILRVEDSQLAHMRSKDPMEIWNALARLHIARGFATRLALRRGFLRLVKGNDERMAAWIGRVKAFSFRLEDVGVEVTDEDRILALTNGLDKTYEAFLISLDATPPELLSLAHVTDRLLNEETGRENRAAMNSGETAFYTTRGNHSGSGQGGGQPGSGGPPVCWRCGKAGHIKEFCREEPVNVGPSTEREKSYYVASAQLRDLGERTVGTLY